MRITSSRAAADVAVRLASVFGARIVVLHVLEPIPQWPVPPQEHREQVAAPLGELTEHLTAQKVEVAEPLPLVGPPADTIVRTANEIDADLILIGAGELSRFERFSAGPVATAVIECAAQPVLAVHPDGPTTRFEKILCAVDQSGPAARGLRNAIRLAGAFGGQSVCRLARCVRSGPRWPTAGVPRIAWPLWHDASKNTCRPRRLGQVGLRLQRLRAQHQGQPEDDREHDRRQGPGPGRDVGEERRRDRREGTCTPLVATPPAVQASHQRGTVLGGQSPVRLPGQGTPPQISSSSL
jgi:nucleotide-binding universal stress UspA family protein